jgi:hypothetical protein
MGRDARAGAGVSSLPEFGGGGEPGGGWACTSCATAGPSARVLRAGCGSWPGDVGRGRNAREQRRCGHRPDPLAWSEGAAARCGRDDGDEGRDRGWRSASPGHARRALGARLPGDFGSMGLVVDVLTIGHIGGGGGGCGAGLIQTTAIVVAGVEDVDASAGLRGSVRGARQHLSAATCAFRRANQAGGTPWMGWSAGRARGYR